MSKIVITTAGSLGDLHPYVAIALELQRRGHNVVVGTSPCYQPMIRSLGLGYHAIRPDSDWLTDPAKVRRLSHPRWGLIRVAREWLMPSLRASYEDTLAAAEDADLLVAMIATYATRLVAEKTSIPWVSALHIPLGFFSALDPPVVDVAPALSKNLRGLGRPFWRPLFWLGKRASRFLAEPWYRLRAQIGLPRTREGNPIVDSFSPLLTLALFSPVIAERQLDWPRPTVITGFPFYDRDRGTPFPPALDEFLSEGPSPVVFTLGSAVSRCAGSFYEVSLACAKLLQRRAVLVVGKGNTSRLPMLDTDAIAVEYAPFGDLFPQSAAIVHHGGIGTTGLAMRSGRPALVVPFAWDQYDNGARVARLGVGRTMSRRRFTAARAAAELRLLLDNPAYSQRALGAGEQIRQENGVRAACDALEHILPHRLR